MAVVVGDMVTPITDVDEFYTDLARWLPRAREVMKGEVPLSRVEQVPAVPRGAKVLCVGLNYRAHAEEAGRDSPACPNIFARWPSTLIADGDVVPLPAGESQLDYEAELVAVVGAELRGIDRASAAAGIFGYACGNDITARGYQHRASQWALGKNADRSGPIGSIITADEVGEVGALDILCRLNGNEVQRSRLCRMIFTPEEILEYASGCLTLQPGDVVFTGTPEGVGFRRAPPVLMTDGDTVEVEIERIGVLTNRVVARA